MARSTKSLLCAAALLVTVGAAVTSLTPKVIRSGEPAIMEYLTPSVKVQGIYPSMLGPENTDLDVSLRPAGDPQLLWVTGYRADMVGPNPAEPRSSELMCHNTLSFHDALKSHAKVMGSGYHLTRRLFTLSQGQSSLDFPPGFGIPVSSAEKFMLQSQVLNLREDRIGSEVRHRVRTEFLADEDATTPMQALTLIDFGISLEVVDKQAREAPENPLSCAGDAGGQPTFHRRADGQEMTAHWLVKPGHERRVTRLAKPFKFDTTLHYIAAHLHSYAQSLELRDLTTNSTVYIAKTRATPDRQGLAEVEHYSSVEGIQVYASHEYELISDYNNTSNKEQTAMAFMFCYAKDPYFIKPDATALAQRSEEFCAAGSGKR